MFDEICNLISSEVDEVPKEYSVGKFHGLGWLFIGNIEDSSPLIAIKEYEKTVNVYFFLFEDGRSVIEDYQEVFKKSNLGKSCICLRSLTDEKRLALRKLAKQASMRANS